MESAGYSFAPGMKIFECLHGLGRLLGNQPNVISVEGRMEGAWNNEGFQVWFDFIHSSTFLKKNSISKMHGKILEIKADLIYNAFRRTLLVGA